MFGVIKGNPNRTLRGAILGCGHIAPFHLRAWSQIQGVEIAALANRTFGKAEARAREFGLPLDHIYSDYQELLEKEEIDFVDIATAPQIHRQQVEAASRHGLHVLCQKPFAPSLEDARAMISASNRAGVLFSINENWRWRSWYREVKRLLDSGLIGRPRYICIYHRSNGTLPLADGSLPRLFIEQPYTIEMDKLIVFEWGVHLIDLLRFFFGEVKSIYAQLEKVSPLCKGEDRALLILELDGIKGIIDISWATIEGGESPFSRSEQMTLEGDEGTIELLPHREDCLRLTTRNKSRQYSTFKGSSEEAYQASFTAAQTHFIECLREGRIPETAAGDNYKSLAVTLAAYESAARNQVIQMDDFYVR
ncbi:MAG: Gfo/Idh/MocA family oxidoreductase [Spirochaetota bacterium]